MAALLLSAASGSATIWMAALLLGAASGAHHDPKPNTIDQINICSGSEPVAGDDRLVAVHSVLVGYDPPPVSYERLLDFVAAHATYDGRFAMKMALLSKSCFGYFRERLRLERWQRRLRGRSSDSEIVEIVDKLIAEFRPRSDSEKILTEIFTDEVAALFLGRLLRCYSRTILSLFDLIGRIPAVFRLIPGWAVLVVEFSPSSLKASANQTCQKILQSIPDDTLSVDDIPNDVLEMVRDYPSWDPDASWIGSRLPKPFSQIRPEYFEPIGIALSMLLSRRLPQRPGLARTLYFLGTSIRLDVLNLHLFTDAELQPVLPFVFNAARALATQICVLIQKQKFAMIAAILQSDDFRFGTSFYIRAIIRELIRTEGLHALLRMLLRTPFADNALAVALLTGPRPFLQYAVQVGNADAVRELLLVAGVNMIDQVDNKRRRARYYAVDGSEIADLLDEADRCRVVSNPEP